MKWEWKDKQNRNRILLKTKNKKHITKNCESFHWWMIRLTNWRPFHSYWRADYVIIFFNRSRSFSFILYTVIWFSTDSISFSFFIYNVGHGAVDMRHLEYKMMICLLFLYSFFFLFSLFTYVSEKWEQSDNRDLKLNR